MPLLAGTAYVKEKLGLALLDRLNEGKLIFGHRGVPDETPENTIASFERSVEMGLDGIELDVQLCRTGELVIIHDEKVDKLTDGSGAVKELSFDELRALDAGSKFSVDFKGEKIPTFEETLDVLGGKMIVNIELKTRSIPDDGLEAKAVAVVEKMNLGSSVIFSSFNPFSVRRARMANPEFKVALLFAEDQPIHLRRAWGLHFVRVDAVHPRFPLVSPKLMKRARAKGWVVNTWTVDKAAKVKELFDMGVSVVITNHPRRMREELGI
jgi:glycerophosphoryl diester phosphodiesterase